MSALSGVRTVSKGNKPETRGAIEPSPEPGGAIEPGPKPGGAIEPGP